MTKEDNARFWYLLRTASESSLWEGMIATLKAAWEKEEDPPEPQPFVRIVIDTGLARVAIPTTKPSERAKALRERLFGDMLSVDEVAYVLDVDRSTVLRYVRDNAIFAFKVGGREWCIPEQSIRDYVAKAIAKGKAEE